MRRVFEWIGRSIAAAFCFLFLAAIPDAMVLQNRWNPEHQVLTVVVAMAGAVAFVAAFVGFVAILLVDKK